METLLCIDCPYVDECPSADPDSECAYGYTVDEMWC